MRRLLVVFFILSVVVVGCDQVSTNTGTVEGTVRNGQTLVGGAYLLLLTNPDDITQVTSLTDVGEVVKNAAVSGEDGTYTMYLVQPGWYYLLAVNDKNSNGELDLDEDEIGWYGYDTTVVETVEVQEDTVTVDTVLTYTYTIPDSFEVIANATYIADIETLYVIPDTAQTDTTGG